jgi:nucleoside 2-deoxyribosyltransferase
MSAKKPFPLPPKNIELVYIAGPYWHELPDRRQLHVESAKLHALLVAELGLVPVTPHLNTARFETLSGLPESFFLQADERILMRCDAVLLLPGSYKSNGTQSELRLAKARGLPVFENLESLRHYVQSV